MGHVRQAKAEPETHFMPHPLLYEINTRCWLRELSEARGWRVTLGEVPDPEFERWQRLGFTHIWLMGIWTSGPRAREQALNNPDLRRAYSEILGDWTEVDVGPSPYAIAAYQVPAGIGGNKGLAKFRRKLRAFGLKLILDFVPNHLGLDHPWISERPELFVQAASLEPGTFSQDTASGRRHLAYGKDPYSPAWTDTVQVDYRRAGARAAMTAYLKDIAERCDGVRCDMAMLLLNEVFAKSWKHLGTTELPPASEFWTDAITAVRQLHPEFLFLAEVYWGLEARLQALGFDYTYDKALYDALISKDAKAVQQHLLGMPSDRLAAGAHFLENHDERRIGSILSMAEHRAAALVILGLPGMRFLHEGQMCGLRRRLPVQLLRRAREPEDLEIRAMYEQLLVALKNSAVGQGRADLLVPRSAWADNPTGQNFLLVQWRTTGPNFDLVVVNLAPHASQCYASLELPAISSGAWALGDLVGKDHFIRDGEDLQSRGLYLDLPAHGAQVLHFEPIIGSDPGHNERESGRQ